MTIIKKCVENLHPPVG